MTLISGLLDLQKSRPLNERHTVRPRQNSGLGHTDKQTMLHDSRDTRKRMRYRGRVVNPAERRIDDPVAAIRDESIAGLALS
jgi:hypothetical protein